MNKYVVSLGINNYPNPGNNLKGCVNDSLAWFGYLKEYGFSGKLIHDSDVTYKRVCDEIIAASKICTQEGDWFVLTYSGHGSSVPDANKDEADGLDECICLYDKWLIDDDIRKLFSLFAKGVNIVFISDSCHSGTVTRHMFNDADTYRIPKFLVPVKGTKVGKLPKKVKGIVSMSQEEMNDILISGCNSAEYSYDAYFAGKYFGAFTYNAMIVLKDQKSIVFNDFFKKLKGFLPSNQYPQTPQLEGKEVNKGKVMFV